MSVNGITGEMELNTRQAADGRHPPVIVSYTLPAVHIALPEGTIMVEDTEPGTAKASASATFASETVLGVLNVRVEANEQSGNIMLHGSCPADILKYVDDGDLTDATATQIEALRRNAQIYV
jgi:hypothetical protein